MHFAQWKEIGKPMPFAIAIGTDPLIPLVASMAIPAGINEADVIGGLRGKPLEVVKGETVDLFVPHNAEIVIEGTVDIDQTRSEGPFGEYTGYMTSTRKEQPVFHVSALTHRDDPILTVVCPGEPVDDHLCMSVSLAADALCVLRQNNIPVIMTYIPPIAALHLLIIAVDKKAYQGNDIIQDIGQTIWSTKIGTLLPKILVVDSDIDPTDTNKVLWSFATKCHPQKGVVFFPSTVVFPLSPYLYPEEKKNRKCTTVIFDCTWPSDWNNDYIPQKGSFDSLWPKEIQEKVLSNWTDYGFSNYEVE
ncbi:MAG TPA: UbiD family decarboxylase [Methylomusa anaerophila]|nr:UbiD family decarboxylase [Methylomusa anaerophila]HML90128.1 UbiD family decarboxylase [Methylomusa anaerophila]